MKWLAIIGMVLVFVSTAVFAAGSDKKENPDGLSDIMRICCVIAIYVGMGMWGTWVMMDTFKDALNSNPYKKEYIYKQSPDGSMVKYDSIYVRKK